MNTPHETIDSIERSAYDSTMSGEVKEKWEDRFDSFIEELKKDAGEIPENTCPDIDKCIKEIEAYEKEVLYIEKNAKRYDTVEEVINDLPSYGLADSPTDHLEDLRKDNEQLRELGKTWYQNCKDMKSFIEYERTLAQQEILDRVEKTIRDNSETVSLPDGYIMTVIPIPDFIELLSTIRNEITLSTLKDTNI